MVTCLRLSKKPVIASQCAHWRGNPFLKRTNSALFAGFCLKRYGFPRRFAPRNDRGEVYRHAKKSSPDGLLFLFQSMGSIELCAGGDVRIHHQQMELFFAVFVMHGGDQHTAGVDTHHRAGRQVRNGDAGLSNQLFRLIILVNSAQNDPIYAGSVVQNEL